MKYWTLFTLRMMALVGLAVSSFVWLVSQWGPVAGGVPFGPVQLRPQANAEAVSLFWFHNQSVYAGRTFSGYVPAPDPDEYWPRPDFPITNVEVSGVGRLIVLPLPQFGFLELRHWFVCLVFLIAAVVTSRPWKKRPIPALSSSHAGNIVVGEIQIERREIDGTAVVSVRDVCELLSLDVRYWAKALHSEPWATLRRGLDDEWYISLGTWSSWMARLPSHLVPVEQQERLTQLHHVAMEECSQQQDSG